MSWIKIPHRKLIEKEDFAPETKKVFWCGIEKNQKQSKKWPIVVIFYLKEYLH